MPAAPAVAQPRPLRAVGRPRLDAALRAALSHRLSGHGRSMSSSASASSARRLRAIPSSATHPASRRRPAPSVRVSANAVGMALARAAAQRAARRRRHRSPHLRHRRRRLPDGRHQPRGHLARRSPQLGKLIVLWDDNAISIDGATTLVRLRRSDRPLQGLGLEHRLGRRPRSRSRRGRAVEGEGRQLEALADRLQDHHRLRRADQGRHIDCARRPGRSSRDHRRA